MVTRLRSILAPISILLIGLLGGCGVEGGLPSTAAEPFSGGIYNYIPTEGPSELADMSSIVIRGTTGKAQEGRTWGTSFDDPVAETTLVFPIEVEEVLDGELDPAVEGTVYVEMFVAGSPVREKFAEGFSGRTGVFYLHRITPGQLKKVDLVDPDAGRPEGQPLYQPTSPEGTLIEARNGSGIWSVGVSAEFIGASLEDFDPARETFPTGPVSGPRPTTGVFTEFDPAASPSELADRSDLVVIGSAGDPSPGRYWGPTVDSPETMRSIVVPISVSKVESGQLPANAADTVYVELSVSVAEARDSINEGLEGREGIFYLSRMPDVIPETTQIVDPEAGRPVGQLLFQETTPQGLIVESNDGEDLWSVVDGATFADTSIEDVAPSSDNFPDES